MKSNSKRPPSIQTGFTLVEIMVGLTIGMLLTLVIVQVMSVFEAQKRTTTGTADAGTNGGIALFTLERDLQLAGYPLLPVTNSPLDCTTLFINGVTDTTIPNGLTPVTITDGGNAAGASDSITVRYSTSVMGGSTMIGVPTMIIAPPAVLPPGVTANDANVDNNLGCQVGDVALTIDPSGATCAMTSVTGPTDIANPPVASIPANTTYIRLLNNTNAVGAGNISCLGTWNTFIYRVNGGNLERCDLVKATASGGNCNLVIPNVSFVPSVAGIVNIKAQYGISASTDSNQITQWVEATAATGWNAPVVSAVKTAANNRNRIKAIRIAVVARNAKWEAGTVTTACSSTTTANPTGLCAWDATSAAPATASPAPMIDLSNDPNWAHYRYRVFETIIPLRNVIWSRSTL